MEDHTTVSGWNDNETRPDEHDPRQRQGGHSYPDARNPQLPRLSEQLRGSPTPPTAPGLSRGHVDDKQQCAGPDKYRPEHLVTQEEWQVRGRGVRWHGGFYRFDFHRDQERFVASLELDFDLVLMTGLHDQLLQVF